MNTVAHKNRVIRVGLAALVVSQISVVVAAPASSPRQEIEAIFKRNCAAFERKDLASYTRSISPTYRATMTLNRSLSRAEYLQQCQISMAQTTKIKCAFQILKFRSSQNKAYVTYSQSTSMTLKSPPSRKPSILRSEGLAEDIWIKSKGTWLMDASKVIAVTYTLDGKPIKSEW
jgi:hypothetical protein